MQSPTETGSKKHIVAERFYETEVSENLCNLFISNYKKFQVLSLYSDLSKKLVAYKLIQQNSEKEDVWLKTLFLKKIYVDFNPDFEFKPSQFSEIERQSEQDHITIHPESPEGMAHFTKGLIKYNVLRNELYKLYLFISEEKLNILLFKGKNCEFNNTFTCNNETEMLYYTLNTLHINAVPQEQSEVFIDCHLAQNNEFKTLFQPYFKSLNHLKPDMEDPDLAIPFLSEYLFANYLMSLCE